MKSKVLLTGLGPISNKIASHKAAQAIIYADQIREAGNKTDINLVSNKITDYSEYDALAFYHGSDWSGNLNLFGGIQAYPNREFLVALSRFKGPVNSLMVDFPDYAGMFQDRLRKAAWKWDDVDWEGLKALQYRAVTIDPNKIKRYNRISIGDSHAICMYRPRWENVSRPFSTLHGSIKKGFETFIPGASEYDIIETYFGNIDIRHHLCRFDDPILEAKKLADRYARELNRISRKYQAKTLAYEPLPIENESRKVPKTGWYKGTPFFGSWDERNEVREAFISQLQLNANVYMWTDQLKNGSGELNFDVMEKPQSVHLSRASYPHWQGRDWTEPQETSNLDSFFA
jgi:hypothetical protein